jgi:hypothetical protein
MAIDGHGRREPLPLLSRAYISAPRAPLHPPSHTPKLPRLPLPSHALATAWSASRRAIAAARASSLSVTPPSSHSSLLRIGGLHVHLFKSAGSLAPPTELASAVFEFRPPASIVAAALSLPLKLPHVVRKPFPIPSSFLLSHACHRRSSAADHPPPLAPCLGRRLNLPCKHPISFAIPLAMRRHFLNAKS